MRQGDSVDCEGRGVQDRHRRTKGSDTAARRTSVTISAAVAFALICTGPSIQALVMLHFRRRNILSIKPGTLANNPGSGLCLFNVVQRLV